MLQTPTYNIDAGSNISTLFEESWKVFSPFISKYQWAFDDPSHSPRKTEIAHSILNRGKGGCCTFQREGYRYILPVLLPRHFEKAIIGKRKIYYVSYGSNALLYFDIDLHCDWQTLAHGNQARTLLDNILPQLFWNTSSRGANGYLKANLQGQGYEKANAVFDRLEHALQLYLAEQENLADFEIKGKIGFLDDEEYIWKQYGKLPIHSPDWNFARLKEFDEKPFVDLRKLNSLCDQIEAAIPQAVLDRHKAYKESLGDQPIIEGKRFLVTPSIEKALLEKHGEAWRYMFLGDEDKEGGWWLPLKYYRPGEAPITEWEYQKEKHDEHLDKLDRPSIPFTRALRSGPTGPKESRRGIAEEGETPGRHDQRNLRTSEGSAHRRGGPVNLDLRDLIGEPDSFKRQKEALFRLARYLKRVPTLEEALDFIQDKSLFSGEWEQNQRKRQTRVQDILDFITRTFDNAKCGNTGSINVGKYDEWAQKKFPRGFGGARRRYMTEFGEIEEGEPGEIVGSSFVAVFMAICEFALLTDKNQDGSFPHDRAEALWKALYAKDLVPVQFDADKWAICREELVKYDIVRVTDRNYRTGKAMKWEVGTYFPGLGLWKAKRQPSMMGPGCFTVKKNRREEEHNTWLPRQLPDFGSMSLLIPARPPP